MANRILGMGDVLTLIDKAVEANQEMDIAAEADMAARLKKGKFDFEMYLESMKQMRKLGGLGSILSMLPGGNKISSDQLPDEKELARMEAIVLSMTPEERRNPKLMSPSRKKRIADGSGNDIAVVNRFIKNFEQSQKVMKQLGGMKKGKHGGFGNMMNMGRMLGGNNKFF
jgi:signal recognition particle subunit SRP54